MHPLVLKGFILKRENLILLCRAFEESKSMKRLFDAMI